MSYQVHITSTAEHDIMRAADYIEFTLRNPDAADNLLDAATEQIGSLAGTFGRRPVNIEFCPAFAQCDSGKRLCWKIWWR